VLCYSIIELHCCCLVFVVKYLVLLITLSWSWLSCSCLLYSWCSLVYSFCYSFVTMLVALLCFLFLLFLFLIVFMISQLCFHCLIVLPSVRLMTSLAVIRYVVLASLHPCCSFIINSHLLSSPAICICYLHLQYICSASFLCSASSSLQRDFGAKSSKGGEYATTRLLKIAI
jgi:hypothetical protein